MKNYILIFLFSIISITQSFGQEEIDLFILAGQSNAAGWRGYGRLYPDDPEDLDKDILLNYRLINSNYYSDGWETMGVQYGRYSFGIFGPEVTFSRELKKAGYNPAFFKYCEGGSSIFEDWLMPGEGGNWDDMIRDLKIAIADLEAQGYKVKSRAFIWVQGESDADFPETAAAYEGRLTTLIADLRENVLNEPKLPVILGVDEQIYTIVNNPDVLNGQQNIAYENEEIKFTSMYGLPKEDKTHLKTHGILEQGLRINHAYQLIVNNTLDLSDCSVQSGGTNVVSSAKESWGQSFKMDCSGFLSDIQFGAANTVKSKFTLTVSNGADCDAVVLHTQELEGIKNGDNLIQLDTPLYLDEQHTYYLTVSSDQGLLWRIIYNETNPIIGVMRTYFEGAEPSSCKESFPEYDWNIQANVYANPENLDSDNDGYVRADDCNDFDAGINPGKEEVLYNGKDDDCNPDTLDDDLDQDGYAKSDDCDDNNPNINPGQEEIPYNGIDDDCNPSTRDDDLDQDGFIAENDCDDTNAYINPDMREIKDNGLDDDCNDNTSDGFDDADKDGYTSDKDCDDNNPNVNPGMVEIPYNGLDDDCNPATLENDLDQDGYVNDVDCNDNNPNINPGVEEIPFNGINDDCDTSTPDDFVDVDKDGYGDHEDCDDNNASINPGINEIPYNGIDDDCNPDTPDDDLDGDGYMGDVDCDDNNPNVNPGQVEIPKNDIDDDCNEDTSDDYEDADEDGFGNDVDCDDYNPNINPGVAEILYNGIDDDCNPLTLDDDLDQDGYVLADDCNDSNPNINPGATEIPYNGIDDDCNIETLDDDLDKDGYTFTQDCDDSDPAINPGVGEKPYNGLDDDCNTNTPDDDLDGDGFINIDDCDDYDSSVNANSKEILYNGLDDDCNPETLDDDLDGDGYSKFQDCDDENPDINPALRETPYNGIDDDCNPGTPDDDLDKDGYTQDVDCDDRNPNINPGQEEIPYNGTDDDCNPDTPDDDIDGDGFKAYLDCDDNDPNINPGAEEISGNTIDENCDGEILRGSSTTEIEGISITIEPNPASNYLQISMTEYLDFRVSIYTVSGFLIYSAENEYKLDLKDFVQGTYFIEIIDRSTGNKFVDKVVVLK